MSIKDFKIDKKLGEGAFAQVYKVLRFSDNQYYAMKNIKINKLSNKEKENVLNEIRFLATFKSPYIVDYKQSFLDEKTQTLHIIMEYCECGDLLNKIRSLKQSEYIEEHQIWDYTIQLLNGLKYLHDLKIFHRDLKSANIFLTNSTKIIKIGDLGVSKIAEQNLLHTQTGTPYYCCPEIWADKPYSQKSDVWSLGCVLYEIAMQQTPFKAENMSNLYKKIQLGVYPSLNTRYSSDLAKVISFCLQVNSKQRLSVNQLLELDVVQKRINPQIIEMRGQWDLDEASKNELYQGLKMEKDIKKLKYILPMAQYDKKQHFYISSCCQLNMSEGQLEEECKTNNKEEIIKQGFVKVRLILDGNKQFISKKNKQIQLNRVEECKEEQKNYLKQQSGNIYEQRQIGKGEINYLKLPSICGKNFSQSNVKSTIF